MRSRSGRRPSRVSERAARQRGLMDSPLNMAHLQARKAEKFLVAGKYEDAIACHVKAAGFLDEAMKLTDSEQALLSMRLQQQDHLTQQRLVRERWRRAQREQRLREELQRRDRERAADVTAAMSAADACDSAAAPLSTRGAMRTANAHMSWDLRQGGACRDPLEREPDTLLYYLLGGIEQSTLPGTKVPKDARTVLEEQRTHTADLLRMLGLLLRDNERLRADNERLRAENEALRADECHRMAAVAAAAADAAASPGVRAGLGLPVCGLDSDTHFVDPHEVWGLAGMGAARRGLGPAFPHALTPLGELPPLELPTVEGFDLRELEDNSGRS
ncbi:nuclear receptor-binding factor 2 [Petromyzon marinus]|uniref:Nuclear receptor-binding factor 2 n=1 Tax=Petromyzon marinus TaxID=7757 RepID=A0AAJ7T066_PETMA|nr:nuclear receptor-binding factor 2 [Petromyzon marinus]